MLTLALSPLALGFAGASALGWGTLALVGHDLHSSSVTSFAHRESHPFKNLLAGTTLGILLVQVAIGELRDRYRAMRRRLPEASPDRGRDGA